MATLEELRDTVIRIVQDSSYTDEIIDSVINDGLLRSASLVLLPDLMSTGTISTLINAYSVVLPSSWNFDRNLYLCSVVSDKRRLKVFSSVALLANSYPNFNLNVESGIIDACTATRLQFIYYPVPSVAETLVCAFYKKPTLLSSDTDAPSILPEFLHSDLLANYACFKLFNEIEQGMDGVQLNTKKYLDLFSTALSELAVYFKTGQSRPTSIKQSGWI